MSNLTSDRVSIRKSGRGPRPDLEGKVSETPEVDPTMVNFMKKWAKGPRKGLDRAWRSCQDRLLDISGPITKILELGFQSKESGVAVDLNILIGWAQHAICQIGNAKVALSTEQWRSILMLIDPKLTDLASSEAGPMEQGLLSNVHFVKDLAEFVANHNTLDKEHLSLKTVF
ncbi:hypothetical protein NDU88_003839 [Pleurodeles waltl]|uniref:Uncharacterized protein n=1 Tax=Pleurodeles waltl TaxID=8319 RepID=A0AAV7PDC1_PLEWA|nr:hypothetical protein NDU88_003839 [Pleurodeles waltl]